MGRITFDWITALVTDKNGFHSLSWERINGIGRNVSILNLASDDYSAFSINFQLIYCPWLLTKMISAILRKKNDQFGWNFIYQMIVTIVCFGLILGTSWLLTKMVSAQYLSNTPRWRDDMQSLLSLIIRVFFFFVTLVSQSNEPCHPKRGLRAYADSLDPIRGLHYPLTDSLVVIENPASILHKSIAGRYRPVSYPDGPITARYRFM